MSSLIINASKSIRFVTRLLNRNTTINLLRNDSIRQMGSLSRKCLFNSTTTINRQIYTSSKLHDSSNNNNNNDDVNNNDLLPPSSPTFALTTPQKIPDFFPNIPLIPVSRHLLFPGFLKMIEVCASLFFVVSSFSFFLFRLQIKI
jgi:hypothetical protein